MLASYWPASLCKEVVQGGLETDSNKHFRMNAFAIDHVTNIGKLLAKWVFVDRMNIMMTLGYMRSILEYSEDPLPSNSWPSESSRSFSIMS
jgi:hypothetical protein